MSDALLWNEIGNLYLQLGRHQEAISAIKRAIEMDPRSSSFQRNLGQAYYHAREYGNALHMFRRCVSLMHSPKEQALVWNKIGDTCRELQDLESAMQAYKKADDLNLGMPGSDSLDASSIACAAGSQKKLEMEKESDASELLSGLKKLVSQMEYSLGEKPTAKELPSEHEPPEKQESLDDDTQPSRAVKRNRSENPASSPALDPPQANPHPIKQADTLPGSGKKTIYVYPNPNGDKEKAPGRSTEQGVMEKPAAPITRVPDIPNLQEILAKVKVYENITRSNPSNDRAWDTLGKLYKALGRYDEAIAAYLKAIEIAPARDIYSYYLGLLYSVQQKHELAVEAFQTVLQRNPDYVLAHGALAGVFHRLGQENKANHHIAIALPMMEKESEYNQACFYAICGDNEKALECLKQALNKQDTTIEWVKSDPDLDPVRGDPRYLELISHKDGENRMQSGENYYSNNRSRRENRLLPHLNSSLAR